MATVCGLLCVWLTIVRNIWCWPTGLIQVILYIFIFYRVRLYSDLILQVIYVFMQLYGWRHWLRGGRDRSELPVSDLNMAPAAGWWATGCLLTIPWGWLMGTYARAALPYPDGFITIMSLGCPAGFCRGQRPLRFRPRAGNHARDDHLERFPWH